MLTSYQVLQAASSLAIMHRLQGLQGAPRLVLLLLSLEKELSNLAS